MTDNINIKAKIAVKEAGDAGYADGYDTNRDMAEKGIAMEVNEKNVIVPEAHKNNEEESVAYIEGYILGARDFANDWIE